LLLFVQVVDNEKVLSVLFIEVDSINFVIIWLTVANYITEVVAVVKDVVRWVDKHFHLISDFEFDSNQVNILLLEKNHHNIRELTTSVNASFQNNSVKFILSSCLVVMDPKLLLC
jgi:hypothetical protein